MGIHLDLIITMASDSESIGEVDRDLEGEVREETMGKVAGPINMAEPWLEGPGSDKEY